MKNHVKDKAISNGLRKQNSQRYILTGKRKISGNNRFLKKEKAPLYGEAKDFCIELKI